MQMLSKYYILKSFIGFVTRNALLFLLFFCTKLTAQITYYTPIDSIRIDSTDWGFEKYSIIKDSIGTDGLFYKGVGNYYNNNNPTQNNSWFKSSEYDIDKRKIKYRVWNEVNGVRNYFLNERFAYNGKGLKTHYSNSTINREQDTSWIYTDFDSLLSMTFIDHDLINNISKGIKYDYAYDSDNKLSRMIPTILSSGVWVQQWEFNYYYGNGGNLPETLLVNHLGIQYQRDLSYKNISGKDSLIIKQLKDQSTNLWTTKYSHEYSYDTVGRLIRHMEWYGPPANLESESEETWIYNNNNQLLRRQFIYYGGGGNSTAYTYYSNGRVATYYYGNGDSMGNYDYEEHNYRYLPVSLPSLNAFDFLIYPNPATDNIEILINIEQKGICTIRLFNSLGQVVINQLTELPSGNSSVHIPLNSITKGLYLIGVDFGKSTLTKKLSIIK